MIVQNKVKLNDLVLLKYGAIGTKLGRVERHCRDNVRFKVQLFYSPSAKCTSLKNATKHWVVREPGDVIHNFGYNPIVSRDVPGLVKKIRQFKKTLIVNVEDQ